MKITKIFHLGTFLKHIFIKINTYSRFISKLTDLLGLTFFYCILESNHFYRVKNVVAWKRKLNLHIRNQKISGVKKRCGFESKIQFFYDIWKLQVCLEFFFDKTSLQWSCGDFRGRRVDGHKLWSRVNFLFVR